MGLFSKKCPILLKTLVLFPLDLFGIGMRIALCLGMLKLYCIFSLLLALTFCPSSHASQCKKVMSGDSRLVINYNKNSHTIFHRNLSHVSFSADRGYFAQLGSKFANDLMSLRENQIWFDSGSGLLNALREYPELGGKAKTLGLSFERPADMADLNLYQQNLNTLLATGRHRQFEGIYLESLKPLKKPVDIITDIHGPFTYSKNLEKVLSIYLENLKLGGRIYISHSTHTKIQLSEARMSPEELAYRSKSIAKGKDPDLIHDNGLSYILNAIRGIEWNMINGNNNTIKITKTSEQVEIPKFKFLEDKSNDQGMTKEKVYFVE